MPEVTVTSQIRSQISDSNENTVYDNGTQQAIGGGSIVMHN
jgi:hypothetical protein